MDLFNQTKRLCKLYNIKPARSKGQNFLVNDSVYNQIIEAAELKKDDVVLEVGPGLGFLTAKLAARVRKVITVELDDRLAEVLTTGLKSQGIKNVEVRNKNILDLQVFSCHCEERSDAAISGQNKGGLRSPRSLSVARDDKFKIVANLPYNITSIFLRKFLTNETKPESMVLMLQKEVAERICARAGKMSLLSVSVQFYAEPQIIDYVPKENFWPEPEVDSAIVKLKLYPSPFLKGRAGGVQDSKSEPTPTLPLTKGGGRKPHPSRPLAPPAGGALPLGPPPRRGKQGEKFCPAPSPLEGDLPASARLRQAGGWGEVEKKFFQLVKFGFSARRKMLKNNLAAGYQISHEQAGKRIKMAGFSENCRAQELSVKDWIKLFSYFK